MRWQRGDVVVSREASRGREYIRIPVRVVQDDAQAFALYPCEGTRYAFPPGGWPFGEAHPRAKKEWVPRGRFTRDDVQEIWAEGKRVLAAWPFPTGWEDWTPDPTWPVPELLE